MPVLDYQEVRRQIGNSRSHLLLGNGFSIACDPIFRYQSLYDRAVADGLSERAQAVFQRLGTNGWWSYGSHFCSGWLDTYAHNGHNRTHYGY